MRRPALPRANKPGLPFRDSAFDLVIDRHEAYLSAEVFRILHPGGIPDAAMRRNEFPRTERSARDPTSVV